MGRETQIGLFTTGANGMNFFVKSKPKVVRRWREETLKQFVYGNHGRVRQLFHNFLVPYKLSTLLSTNSI